MICMSSESLFDSEFVEKLAEISPVVCSTILFVIIYIKVIEYFGNILFSIGYKFIILVQNKVVIANFPLFVNSLPK